MTLNYPPSRVVAVTDELAGIRYDDPYRWLEQETAEVAEWQRAQGELAAEYVRAWPHFENLRRLVSKYSASRFAAVPRFAGGRWFRMHTQDGASQSQILVSDEPLGPGRVLFDPREESIERPPFVSWLSPSPDGTVLAFGVCDDGSEQNTVRLLDVASGEHLPGAPELVLMDNWSGGAQWLSDSSGFFLSAIDGRAVDFTQHVYLYRHKAGPATERLDIPWQQPVDYRMVSVSADGRTAVAVERMVDPRPVALADLDDPEFARGGPLRWRPFITDLEGVLAGHVVGSRYVAVTNVDAPKGRIVSIPLDAPKPNDSSTWLELVSESDAVLRTVYVIGDRLVLSELVDTYARARVLSQQGEVLGQVPLPGRGAFSEFPFPAMNLVPRGHSHQFLFNFSTLTNSWGTYRYRIETGTVETLQSPAATLSNAVVEDRWATSADGTKVPYHLVHRRDVDIDQVQPTMIYAYGGFNVPLVPQYPGAMAAFVAAGGVFVHGHLRGGAELGSDWWLGGRYTNKQNGYSDLFAIAEHLVESGVARQGTMAITGASNGGHMAGVAVTQRPDLWAVAVPRVPVLDIIGACRDPYSRLAVSVDIGDPNDPDDVRRMGTLSPYHLVTDGIQYPAVFLDAGATDPRCPPWHARKFGARLQAANAGDTPVLVRIWDNVGHGWATDKEVALVENTEWLAFVMRRLGMVLS